MTAGRSVTPTAPGLLWPGAGWASQLVTLTARQVRLTFADRRSIVLSATQPLVMLVLFSQVFGSLADPSSLPGAVDYIDFLIPALLVTTGIGTSQTAGVGFVRDLEGGMLRRLRTLPCPLWTALAARSLSELLRSGIQIGVLVAGGVVFFGFRPAAGVGGLVVALLLAMLTTWALIWTFLALAARLRKVETLSSIGFFVSFPLMFASSAFIPVDALPGWLAAIAAVNPVTYAVNASRGLALGSGSAGQIAAAAASALLLTTVTALLAARAIRRPPST